MASLRCIMFLQFLFVAAAVQVSPIDKVISLISDMKTKVEDEAKAEASLYSKFACFCKDTTKTKSASVNKGNDDIGVLSADIGDKTASKAKDSTELGERKVKQEVLSKDLDAANTRCAKEKAEYESEEADLSKAISSLKNARKAMRDSKPSAALLQGSTHQDLMDTLAMADAMNMVTSPKVKALASMLQTKAAVDPSDPTYKFHGDDILDLLDQLHTDFKDEKKTLDTEYGKAKTACDELKKSLKKQMGSNSDAMKALDKNIAKLAKEIAEHRSDLVEANEQMKDDEQYLKDLTARCEDRANDYDQRSAMRSDEVGALSEALRILKGEVKDAADDVNKRALLQKAMKPKVEAKDAPVAVSKPVSDVAKKPVQAPKAQAVKKAVSLLQGLQNSKTFLAAGLSGEARKDKAIAILMGEGQRLGSLVLTSLGERAAADPFEKVKGLIEKLIQRLVAEATAEATKKGFCDTELGKARKDRDFRREETQDISSELEGLEAKEDALTQEIKLLTRQIKEETKVLKETTKERKDEKAANLKTLKTAKEGLDAVNEALLTLRSFYKQAAKAASFVQASPVDEDTSGAGFSGNYKGNQSGSKAVLSLLETISSDFDRTIRTTEAAEEAAHRDYVDFNQHSQASIAGKTTKKELDEQDLVTTKTNLKSKMADLSTAQDLLDDALMELEELKPTCIDTGMSFEQRTKKREEEMKALKNALCILDADKVEPECK